MKLNWSHARRIRQIVQTLFFVLFVVLLFAGLQRQDANPLADFFFRINPLSALTAMLASRSWIHGFGYALIIIGLTVLFGRVWCGWICPTGTLLEWVSFRSARKRGRTLSPRLRIIKYVLLVVILVMALLGNLSLMVFEPLALFTRTMTTVVIPGLNYAVNASEHSLYSLAFLRPAVDWLESALRGLVLPVKQPAFDGTLWIAMLFIVVLGLNWFADRFWCRYFCPLGALLGWLSKFSIFRPFIGSACTGCTACALACKPAAIRTVSKEERTHSSTDLTIMPSECTVCLDCLSTCTKGSMKLSPSIGHKAIPASTEEYDLSRRQFMQSAVLGSAGVVLLRTDLRLRTKKSELIRPPGAQNEDDFLSQCIRCTQCMKICPTTALQPAMNQAGLEGLWTPVLIPRVGYCDYGCNACGQVCPSGAIPLLELDEKRQQVISKASIDHNRCLPWASSTPCIVCEEMCPIPEKAIRFEIVTALNEFGEEIELQQPYVLRDVCIGCGICENHCPLEGEAAIKVYSV